MQIRTSSLGTKAIDIRESIGNGRFQEVALELLDPFRYVQHIPTIPSGRAAILALRDRLRPETTRAHVVRAFQDGDYGFVHVDYNLEIPIVAFDVHLFRDGRSVEHWDNLQRKPAGANGSGRTMVDGESTVTELDSTLANKLLVTRFVEDVLVREKVDKAERYFNGPDLIQHSPRLRDGLDALLVSIREGSLLERSHTRIDGDDTLLRDVRVGSRYIALQHVLGEGNFVLAICEAYVDGALNAIYDLYRVDRSKIVEHWDVVESIPPIAEWKNFNGKF